MGWGIVPVLELRSGYREKHRCPQHKTLKTMDKMRATGSDCGWSRGGLELSPGALWHPDLGQMKKTLEIGGRSPD